MQPIVLMQGNVPLLSATLFDAQGTAVNLTGCTVQFAFQQQMGVLLVAGSSGNNAPYQFVHPANVVGTPTMGMVSYQFAGAETATLGDFQGQWQVTNIGTGLLTAYPLDWFVRFQIRQALPETSPQNIVLIRQMHEPVRTILGDFDAKFRKYQDGAIDSVVRTCLLIGNVPGQTLAVDRLSISPGITTSCDLARLMYHAAKKFVDPNTAQYSYRLRAIEERFGRQELFLRELQNAIYELENGEMFSSFQSFYSWVNALTGIDIWSLMSDMNTIAPVAAVTIGRAGVTVSTT